MSEAYRKAGVNIEAGYEAVSRMKQHVERTMRPEVLSGLGGFGAMFELPVDKYKQPVLVSGTDGVGTKLKLAFALDQHDTIGQDVVAMCVNDIVVQGAEPLYFLDYLATGELFPEQVEAVVKGVADGCEQAGCALIGGETAEMPGFYADGEYDLAGFCVGVVEKKNIIDGSRITDGDVLIGLASSGVHSNGFSLIRKIIDEQQMTLNDSFDSSKTLGQELLTPTRIYVQAVQQVLASVEIHGMAHLTGGGFQENIPRMLHGGVDAYIDLNAWLKPPIFHLIREKGQISDQDMYNTFNMGIGLVMSVAASQVEQTLTILSDMGQDAYQIGLISEGSGQLFLKEESL